MANDVLIDGWVGSDPEDYPEKEEKQRFAHFDIAHTPRGGKHSNWVSINAYGSMADKVVDELQVRQGDKVKIDGFIACRYGRPGCGRTHRFNVVVVRDCKVMTRAKQKDNDTPEDESEG